MISISHGNLHLSSTKTSGQHARPFTNFLRIYISIFDFSHVSTTIDPFWDISLDLGPTDAVPTNSSYHSSINPPHFFCYMRSSTGAEALGPHISAPLISRLLFFLCRIEHGFRQFRRTHLSHSLPQAVSVLLHVRRY